MTIPRNDLGRTATLGLATIVLAATMAAACVPHVPNPMHLIHKGGTHKKYTGKGERIPLAAL